MAQFLKDEVIWFKSGASGDDITARKLHELEARLAHVQKTLGELVPD